MKIKCPNNPHHKKFSVIAHITEGWLVDNSGDFIETDGDSCGEVVHKPNAGDYYTCTECGAEADTTE